SAASAGLSVTIDTVAAAPSAPDLTAASDSGTSNSDDNTKDNTPSVTGSGAEVGATVTLYDTDGTTVLGTGVADGSSKWAITSSTLLAGVPTLPAYPTRRSSDLSAASAGLSVTIDTVAAAPSAPDLTAASDSGTSNSDDNTKDNTPSVTGSGAEVGATVTLY